MPEPEALERIDALAREVEELRADRDEDRALIDELMAELAQQGLRKPKAPPVYSTWQAWVDGWLAARVSRHPHRYRWCHQYAEHPEVADRLEALWHAWESAWPDPLARLAWYRDGLDHQFPIISAEDGPLRECSAAEREHAQVADAISAPPAGIVGQPSADNRDVAMRQAGVSRPLNCMFGSMSGKWGTPQRDAGVVTERLQHDVDVVDGAEDYRAFVCARSVRLGSTIGAELR